MYFAKQYDLKTEFFSILRKSRISVAKAGKTQLII